MGQKKEITRLYNWRSNYSAVVDDLYFKPFVWGENDCAIGLVSKVVKGLTGVDFGEEFKGSYTDPKSGFKLVKKKGFENLADFVGSYLPECHLSEAQIGDIAAVKNDDKFGYGLGVVNGERILVLSEKGIGSVDLFQGERFFKVG